MAIQRPRFELTSVFEDGSRSEPRIVSVLGLPGSARMGRRGFLGVGLGAGAVLGAVAGCEGGLSAVDAATGAGSPPDGAQPPPQPPSLPDAGAGPAPMPRDAATTPQPTQPPPLRPDANADRLPPAPDAVVPNVSAAEVCAPGMDNPSGFKSHPDDIDSIAFHPSSGLLVSGGGFGSLPHNSDNSVRVWSVPEGKLLAKKPYVNSNGVDAVAISPDGTLLASGGYKKVDLWKLPDLSPVGTLQASGGALAFTPDGATLIAGYWGTDMSAITFWSVADRRLIDTVITSYSETLRVTQDGQLLVGVFYDGVEVRQVSDRRVVTTIDNFSPSSIGDIAMSPSGKLVAVCSYESLKIAELPTLTVVRELKVPKQSFYSAAYSPDGTYIYVGVGDSINVYQSSDLLFLRTMKLPKYTDAEHLVVAPNGKWLVTGGYYGVLAAWELSSACPRFRGVFYDASASEGKASAYDVTDANGKVLSYAIPCGTALPPGATCTCNCVDGTYRPPGGGGGGGGGGTICTCNTVCTCVPICQAHRLLHADPVVRVAAEQILLLMGLGQDEYLGWAADTASPEVRIRIDSLRAEIRAGRLADPARWPARDALELRLADPDPVVSVIAAQMLLHRARHEGTRLEPELQARLHEILAAAEALHWRQRAGRQDPAAGRA